MPHSPAPLTADVNAMLWGQFHLRGGWSKLVLFVGIYAAAAGGVVALSIVAGDAMPAAIKVLLVTIQGAILILFAGARVATAIRQDLNTRMIDSHRMMPMSPAQAVLGYLVGAAAQPLALAAANLVLGVVVSAAVGTPAALWLTANAVLASFAAFAAVAMAYGAFAGRTGASTVVWLALFFSIMSSGAIGAILPGMVLLVTPVIGSSVVNLGVTGADAAVLYAAPTLFQLWVGGVCFAAACRKYRRDDRPALGTDLGLALLGGWVAVSLFAMFNWLDYRPASLPRFGPFHPAQFFGSTMMAMLVGLVPVNGAAFAAADWEGRRALGDPSLGRRPAPPAVVAVLAALVTLALAAAPLVAGQQLPGAVRVGAVVRTAVILAAFFVGTSYVLRLAYRGKSAATVGYVVSLWLLVTWAVPIGVDAVRWYLVPLHVRFDTPFLQTASSFSPVGALMQAWTVSPSEPATLGLLFQVALAVAAAVWFHQRRAAPPDVRRAESPTK